MPRLPIHPAILAALLALFAACPLAAQASARSEAIALIQGLDTRKALPPVAEQARLESASPQVCRAIGEELLVLPAGTVARIAPYLAASSNSHINASLLIGMQSTDAAISKTCMNAVAALNYAQISRLKAAAFTVKQGLAEELDTKGHWKRFIATQIEVIGATNDRRDWDARALAFALIVDIFLDPNGFKLIGEALAGVIAKAGERPAAHVSPPQPKEVNEDDGDGEDEDSVDLEAEMSKTRIETIRRLFKTLFFESPDNFELRSTNAQRREKAVKDLWVTYERLFDAEPTTWRAHLKRMGRDWGESKRQARALIIMDTMCGHIRVPLADAPTPPAAAMPNVNPADNPKKDDKKEKDNEVNASRERVQDVPLLPGDTDRPKMDFFESLDRTTKLNKVIRVIEREFDKRFGTTR